MSAGPLRGARHLARSELSACLAEKRIPATGQRFAYILMHAEFAALICSAPRRGRQFTYALLEECAPKAEALAPEEALAHWTVRYFRSHGPAQATDFAWWSGLTLQEARRGLEMAKEQLRSETVSGSAYWLCPGTVVEKSHGT